MVPGERPASSDAGPPKTRFRSKKDFGSTPAERDGAQAQIARPGAPVMSLWNDRPEAWHEVLPGVRRRILTHGHGLMLVLYHIAPGATFPLHSHPHVQAGTFLRGSGVLRVGPERYRMKEGSSYSVPGGVPHELVNDPGGPSVILDAFVPEREDFLPEALPADQP